MKLLYLFAVPALVVASQFPCVAQSEGGYNIIANAFGFRVSVQESPSVEKNIREIAIDELNIDAREMTTGLDVEYRTFQPGQAHWGQACITCVVRPGETSELQTWWNDTSAGKGIRKNISVTLFKSDKTPGRGYSLFDCFPTAYEQAFDSEHDEQIERIYVKPRRLILVSGPSGTTSLVQRAPADATVSDKFAQVRGFQVDITGAGGKEVDTAWESVSGGELPINTVDSTLARDMFQSTLPTAISSGELTLCGAMTATRKEMCQWFNDTVEGKPWKKTVSITEMVEADGSVKPGKAYEYKDCFPVGYVFPRLSVYNQGGTVQEEIRIQCVRLPIVPRGTLATIEIEGAPIASRGVLAAAIDDRALDKGLFPKSKTIRNEELVLLLAPGTGVEFHKWFGEMEEGPVGVGKTVTITMGDKKTGGRKYILQDCFPTQYSAAVDDGSGAGNVIEEVRLKFIRCELK